MMSGLVGRLIKTGLRRGVFEGSQGWLYVGGTALLLRVARRLLTEAPETVYETELKPGQAIEIRTIRQH
jgi:hypothetical protein